MCNELRRRWDDQLRPDGNRIRIIADPVAIGFVDELPQPLVAVILFGNRRQRVGGIDTVGERGSK